ncbi:MAG TPA: TetR/AcrR family transcriptional regulator [Terracidiphilus sp.]
MSKGTTTRQRIIENAAPLFNQLGFAGCSMQDILEATGLQKGGLYRHFSGKEELAAEAFRYALSRAMTSRMPAADPSLNAVEHLRKLIEQFVEAPSAIPGGCPLLNTAVDADDGNSVLRDLARNGLNEWRARIAQIVSRGLRRKEIRAGARPQALANIIIATLEGALMISRLEESKAALYDARSFLEDFVSRLASPPPPR